MCTFQIPLIHETLTPGEVTMPPPSANPGTPVVEMMPPVVASPKSFVAVYEVAPGGAPSARAVRGYGSGQAEAEERELLRLRSAEIERGLQLGESAA